ncbi:MAG: type VI secretion system tube protein Hcp [Gemmatimonadota bacterium]|nr:MAG: type VI secretion system tube protein Hcp [Gemmatimonadota bacterium]
MSRRRSVAFLTTTLIGVLAVTAAISTQVADRQLVLSTGPTVRAYLILEGIAGEATTSGHENWIEVLSFSWGFSNPGPPPGTPMVAGSRANFQDLVITKPIDKSSPLLALACADGSAIRDGELAFYASGSAEEPTGIVRLANVRVSSVTSESGSSGSGLTETIGLTFGRVEWIVYEYGERGRTGETRTGWDVGANSPL